MENIWNLLQTRYGTEQEFGNKLYEPLTGFPLSTVEQFKDFDNVKNKKLRKQVVSLYCTKNLNIASVCLF